MSIEKDQILRGVETRAMEEARYLAGEFARAASAEREAILAGLEFEQWLAQGCREVRAGRNPHRVNRV